MIDSKYLFPLYLRKLAQSTDALQPFRYILLPSLILSSRYLPQSLIARENISFVGLVPSLEVFLEGIEDEEEMELIDRYHKKLAKHPYDMTSEILKWVLGWNKANYPFQLYVLRAVAPGRVRPEYRRRVLRTSRGQTR